MPYSPGYAVEACDDSLVVRFSRSLLDREALVHLLDFIGLESIRKRSALTESSALELEKEIKQSAWDRVQHLFAPT